MKSLSTLAQKGLVPVLGILIASASPVWATQSMDRVVAQTQSPASNLSGQTDVETLKQEAMQEAEAGKTAEAIRDFQRALTLQPDWKEGWFDLGTVQYQASQYPQSRVTFQKVVAFAPTLGIAWGFLGLSEFETKNFTEALEHLERAQNLGIRDDAETARVCAYHLALLRIRADEFEAATDLLTATFPSIPPSTQVQTALGLALLRVPLLPEQVDPSQEALILAAGGLALSPSEALQRFPTVINTYPDVPYLHYAYALALAKADRGEEAQQQLREEIKISPESAAVHTALAATLQSAGQPQQAARERELAASLTSHRDAVQRRLLLRYANGTMDVSPSGASAGQELWIKAMQEYTGAQWAAAASDLKEWLRKRPDDGTGWALLGLCEFNQKQYDNALIHLQRGANLGLRGSPESLQLARSTYGMLLVHAGQFESATDILASTSSEGSLGPRIETALGMALLRKAAFPDELDTTQTTLMIAAGKISLLLQQSRYDEAFPRFADLLQRYPSAPFLHYAYGTAFLALSEFDQAAAQMRAELAISPGSELPCIRLASIALRQHNPADTVAWARKALALNANSAEGHYLLGRASLETGDAATAVRELETASRLSPGSPEVHFNLAKAYTRAKMPEKAEQERTTFTQLNAAAEEQRSHHGSQVYAGPREAGSLTGSPASAPQP